MRPPALVELGGLTVLRCRSPQVGRQSVAVDTVVGREAFGLLIHAGQQLVRLRRGAHHLERRQLLGLQLMGRPFGESVVLRVGHTYEATGTARELAPAA